MTEDKASAYGISLRQDSDKQAEKALLYGSILLFAHLLEIKPAEFEQFSIKIKIPDPVIVYGGLAALFIHTLPGMILSSIFGQFIFRLDSQRRVQRGMLRLAKRNYRQRPVSEIKDHARGWITLLNIAYSPYMFMILAIYSASIVFALGDLYALGDYIFNQLSVVE